VRVASAYLAYRRRQRSLKVQCQCHVEGGGQRRVHPPQQAEGNVARTQMLRQRVAARSAVFAAAWCRSSARRRPAVPDGATRLPR